ncbi:inositol monophosphatase [Thermaurantimonas aggregans]|uniref:Inositol-1-monophosphatase n=1 Tax=Thermaurantimonas aggregans TaxID=2173829 RepID=A0A401XII6_9FLAO|nr:inositol monophosphatase family protein [Thermaurantimonas aggregans]MCX8148772.1 inositol monophosphatase [Thermaurantimonas aggregans]GCD76829.1 inositol monophosphatase [Thermaurantimonas aggregans]
MIDLREVVKKVETVAQRASQFIQNEQKSFSEKSVEIKELNSFVSYVDKTSEELIVNELKRILPEAGFITEEATVSQSGDYEYVWIVDPLDGTTNFIHGLPFYSVSIGLTHRMTPIVGVIYDCGLNDLYSAWKGGGAFKNGQPIKVRTQPGLDKALLATGFPYRDYGRMPAFMKLINSTFYRTRGVRRIGSAAIDLAYVAAGRFDVFFEYGLSPWDVAAGIVIVQEAGGRVTDFSGGGNYLFGGEIVAGQPWVFDDFMELVQESGLVK